MFGVKGMDHEARRKAALKYGRTKTEAASSSSAAAASEAPEEWTAELAALRERMKKKPAAAAAASKPSKKALKALAAREQAANSTKTAKADAVEAGSDICARCCNTASELISGICQPCHRRVMKLGIAELRGELKTVLATMECDKDDDTCTACEYHFSVDDLTDGYCAECYSDKYGEVTCGGPCGEFFERDDLCPHDDHNIKDSNGDGVRACRNCVMQDTTMRKARGDKACDGCDLLFPAGELIDDPSGLKTDNGELEKLCQSCEDDISRCDTCQAAVDSYADLEDGDCADCKKAATEAASKAAADKVRRKRKAEVDTKTARRTETDDQKKSKHART